MMDLTCRTPLARALAACALAASLAACGGGSASGGCTSIDPTRASTLPGCGGSSSGGNPATGVTLAAPAMALVDSAGGAINTVTPDKPGVITVTVKDSAGVLQENAAVTLVSTDPKALFAPASGSALTDSAGVARIGIAASGTAGAFVASAVVVKGNLSAKGTLNYAVAYPTISFSAMALTPNPLSTGGTATVSVTLQSGGAAYTSPLTVTFTSTCAAANKAVLGLPVLTVQGVASTSYVDRGCGAPDPITATATLGGATVTQTGTITTLGTTAGQLGFVSASPANLALKGTGSAGRQESSVVTFRVLDRSGKIVVGAPVNFALSGATGTGGLTLAPSSATSTADGSVTTTVYAGTVPTSVRVLASLAGVSPSVTTLSDQLVVSTGVPHENGLSLSTEIFNVEGANHDGCGSPIGSRVRASLSDHFGNPVPDGTAVNFTAEGGVVGASCLTAAGECSVSFCSASPRQVDERVTIMAYALGEESYVENPAIPNGINRYDLGETFDDLCEPVRSDTAISNAQADATVKNSAATPCTAPAMGEIYIDTNANGLFDSSGDKLYNGVLNADPNSHSTVHVRKSLVQVMSGSTAVVTAISGLTLPTATPASTLKLDRCVDGTPFVNNARTLRLAIRDTAPTIFPGNTLPGNVMPAGTTINFSATNGTIVSKADWTVINTNESNQSVWTYDVTMESDATQTSATATPPYICTNTKGSGSLNVTVKTPRGLITTVSVPVTDNQ